MQTELHLHSKPFLRWAGGKNWLIRDFLRYTPKEGYNNYIEPFLGGGAIFFYLNPEKSYLSDLNSELTDTYLTLKEDVEGIIAELKKYKNEKDFYYKIRSKRPRKSVTKAARFIYLNQTSFNGIYRVNLNGDYNVPYGFRSKNFLDADGLRTASKVLKNTTIRSCDFEDTLNDVNEGDFVFLDPPYTVTHNDNGFIKYNSKLFDMKEQKRLSGYIDEIKNKGGYYVLTNAAHKEVKKIFQKPGDRMLQVSRASLVGGRLAKRGKFPEFIFTNVPTR